MVLHFNNVQYNIPVISNGVLIIHKDNELAIGITIDC